MGTDDGRPVNFMTIERLAPVGPYERADEGLVWAW